MQFTRLRLQGFKSFVDPTELVVSSGLTGVVGPNGCGKSNLLEALRWVMGENRAKAMRGEGMDDVIFAGTDRRPARGAASVELLIDNSDRLAPAAFNTQDRLEVSRRITRDIGSAYTVNGRSVRARDVQMLFADASTGAHSPALVRQGQIAELINAKPKARRRILEEAAGISGLYQRRHEAELKLNAAAQNLARVEDVVEQLETRLKALDRQAAQARRYRAIAEELRRAEAALLFLRWKLAEDERVAADQALTHGMAAAASAERTALATERNRDAADKALPPLREEAAIASAVLQRLTIEQGQLDEAEARAAEEIERLTGRARQIALDVERERTLEADAAGSIERLHAEEARLAEAHAGHDARLTAAIETARRAGAALTDREATLDRLTEEAARLAARAAAAERRMQETGAAAERAAAEVARSEAQGRELEVGIAKAEPACEQARAAATAARQGLSKAEETLERAEAARAEAQQIEASARARASETEGERAAISAEVDALSRLLARDRTDDGQMLDLLQVEPGTEAALGAALGDDLRAPEAKDGSGWVALPPYDARTALPDRVQPLTDKIGGPIGLDRRLSLTGLVEREAGDALQAKLAPGQRLVSAEGDLWRWDGYRVRAEDAPSATALRLQQQNRLKALTAALETARRAGEAAASAHDEARQALGRTGAAESAARKARALADAQVAETARALSRAEADLEMRRGRLENQRMTLAGRREDENTARAALAEAETAMAGVGDVEASRAAVEAERRVVETARREMMSARAALDELRRAGEGRQKRLAGIGRERDGWTARSRNAGARIAELEARGEKIAVEQRQAADLPAEIAEQRKSLAEGREKAEARARAANDALAAAETALKATEAALRDASRAASEKREARARLEARVESAAARVGEAEARIREDLNLSPQQIPADEAPLPTLEAAETDVARLRRQRDSLGAVNLRAEEDAAEVRAELDGLVVEKADLEAAIAKLRAGIGELNREGRQRLLAAFDSVNEKFARLFRHLFDGGEARLVMVDSEDPLDAGLEILCQPPGKKLASLSLLSGGEQTLTALSLIFAVFLSNPAPICVLDEVDAPLDDANVTRFCDLLDEMRRLTGTRFLIITHHAITMSRMDRLFGVTMAERGVSQLVSVDLARAAEMVDA